MTFWLNKGVDGFNVIDSGFLYEDFDLRDDPLVTGAPANSVRAYTI